MAWYGKPELIWMAIAAYAWLLAVLRKDLKSLHSACCCSMRWHRSVCQTLSSAYVQDNFAGGDFLFPNTFTTITEIARVPSTFWSAPPVLWKWDWYA